MKCSVLWVVVAIVTAFAVAGCAEERTNDNPLGAEECTRQVYLSVYSNNGGRVTCDGATMARFDESLHDVPVCMDYRGEQFELWLNGYSAIEVFSDTDGGGVPVELWFQIPPAQPVQVWFFEFQESERGAKVIVTIP